MRKKNYFLNLPLLFSERLEPCLEPLRLSGRELGFELPREPPGVMPVLWNNININLDDDNLCSLRR